MSKMKPTTTIRIRTNFVFNAPKFGIPGLPPPKLNSTLAIHPPFAAELCFWSALGLPSYVARNPPATVPPYLVAFSLDTTAAQQDNARHEVKFIEPPGDPSRGKAANGEHAHAIPARLDRAMHQPAVFRSRALAPRPPVRPNRGPRIRPKLRLHTASRPAPHRPASPHASAVACRAPASASSSALSSGSC